ncbi:acyltransferase family protein [Polluticoccus soli]|uniref:acyltransferase family protein n=1 Tax=Polluticoccus soli TaxID=3034150 RepID=UPI0023E23E65|nr:acyltransferase [Flavipsychrobacter sp. JY13-12]
MREPIRQYDEHPEHLSYLDSVRGLAVLWVMFFHYINQRFHEHSMAKLASFVFNGETAIFLFVLSGFVLSYKYIVLDHELDIRKFYIQRFLRFWPAFFVAVSINALYQYRHDLSIHNLTDQFLFNKGQFWEEASLFRYSPGFERTPQYYLPGWALVVILSMSFLLPFMIALAHKSWRYLPWMMLAFTLIGINMGNKYVYHIHFALGVLISCWFVRISSGNLRKLRIYKYHHLLLGLAVMLFSMRQLGRINRIEIYGPWYKYWIQTFLGIDFSFYSAIASLIFLIAIIDSPRVRRLLSNSSLHFLGRISYCLYLMHWVVVVAIFDNWNLIAPLFPNTISAVCIMMVVCTAVSIALATVLHYTVELPSIRFSKRVTSKLKPSLIIKKEAPPVPHKHITEKIKAG